MNEVISKTKRTLHILKIDNRRFTHLYMMNICKKRILGSYIILKNVEIPHKKYNKSEKVLHSTLSGSSFHCFICNLK